MAIFSVWAKNYSTKYFCNARVGRIFIQRKFLAVQYYVLIILTLRMNCWTLFLHLLFSVYSSFLILFLLFHSVPVFPFYESVNHPPFHSSSHMFVILISCNFLFPILLAKPRKSNEKPSNLFQSLEFFLSNLALHDTEAAVNCFDSTLSTIHTPREVEEYNRVKCSLVLQLLNFVSILLDKHPKQAFTVSVEVVI